MSARTRIGILTGGGEGVRFEGGTITNACATRSPNGNTAALCTLFGTKAVELIADGCYGQMVAFAPPQMTSVPIAEAVGRLRRVNLTGNLVRSARALGICLGD